MLQYIENFDKTSLWYVTVSHPNLRGTFGEYLISNTQLSYIKKFHLSQPQDLWLSSEDRLIDAELYWEECFLLLCQNTFYPIEIKEWAAASILQAFFHIFQRFFDLLFTKSDFLKDFFVYLIEDSKICQILDLCPFSQITQLESSQSGVVSDDVYKRSTSSLLWSTTMDTLPRAAQGPWPFVFVVANRMVPCWPAAQRPSFSLWVLALELWLPFFCVLSSY